jgi:hypothetical protein
MLLSHIDHFPERDATFCCPQESLGKAGPSADLAEWWFKTAARLDPVRLTIRNVVSCWASYPPSFGTRPIEIYKRLVSPRNVYLCPFIDAGLDALQNWSIDTQVMFQPTREHARKTFLGLLERYHGLKEDDIAEIQLESKSS